MRRKRDSETEEALRRSEERFRSIVENAPICIFQSTVGGRVISINRAGARMYGYSSPEEAIEAITNSAMLYAHPEQRPKVVSESLDADGFSRFEIEYRRRDGSTFIGSLYMRAVRGEGGTEHVEGFVEDITDRKQAEETLRESEERYRRLVDLSPVAIFVNLHGKFAFLNAAALALFGASTPEDMIGKNVLDFIGPEHREIVQARIMSMIEGKVDSVPLIQEAFLRLDGSRLEAEVAATRITYQGEVALLVVFRDITERIRSEETLKANEVLLRQYAELTPAAVAMLDRDMRYLLYSRRWLIDYKLGDRDITGLSHYEVFPDIPDRWKEVHQRVLAGSVERCEEDEFVRADGTSEWVQWDVRPWWNEAGEIGGIIMFTEVITKRKQMETALKESEETYRSLVETTDTGYLIANSQGIVADANAEYVRLTGRRSLDEICGHCVLEWTADYDLERNTEEFKKCAETGRVRDLEIDYVSPDGSKITPIEINATVIETRQGPMILTLCRDITERRRAEADKRQFYRDTILSVTDGRLQICDAGSIEPYLAKATVTVEVGSAEDMSEARKAAASVCVEGGLTGHRLDEFVIAAGEAITNAVKHGARGCVYAGATDGSVWIGVTDNGPGIDSLILPKAVLRRGFSTKPSLGFGYSIMLEVADQILLCTGPDGTSVVLVRSIHDERPSALAGILRTWEAVEGGLL